MSQSRASTDAATKNLRFTHKICSIAIGTVCLPAVLLHFLAVQLRHSIETAFDATSQLHKEGDRETVLSVQNKNQKIPISAVPAPFAAKEKTADGTLDDPNHCKISAATETPPPRNRPPKIPTAKNACVCVSPHTVSRKIVNRLQPS